MPADATDRLAIGEIGAEVPAGRHTNGQAGSHDCELLVAPAGQGATASSEAKAGRTFLPAESDFVQNMTTDSNPALTPSGEEVQEHAPAPGVQPQSSNGCTPEVASGNPVSTPGIASGNKPETINSNPAADTISAAPNHNSDMNTMSDNDTTEPVPASGVGATPNTNPNPPADTLSTGGQTPGSPAATTYNSNTNTMSDNNNDGALIFEASNTHSDSGNGFMPAYSASFAVPEGGATAVCSLEVDDWGTLVISGPGGPYEIILTEETGSSGPMGGHQQWGATSNGEPPNLSICLPATIP